MVSVLKKLSVKMISSACKACCPIFERFSAAFSFMITYPADLSMKKPSRDDGKALSYPISADDAAGDFFAGVSGRLGMEIIRPRMDNNCSADNIRQRESVGQ